MTAAYDAHRTLFVLNPDRFAEVRGAETLVICGAARGMTSMVSYALHALNYPLGERLGPLNYEDREFLDCLPETLRLQSRWRPLRGLRRLVRARNAAYPRWGFKLPHAIFYAPVLRRRLRNPVFVVCVRNPLGTVSSISRREAKKAMSFDRMYRHATAYQRALSWLLRQADLPVVLINMDAAKANPGRFLNDLTELLALKGNLHRIKAELEQNGYSAADTGDRRGQAAG
ncbi:hypothetical protein [Aestuariicoccus sp. MJ-SS9]|uniref:hypothetical protein n=1 Tax=Aestuariicoccus sp. MJ-SS9 TaxID=3079855 RepID=UPI00291454BC|nr:hypothetical protein [Aestuariicoccus sp. MJ-SS9]MDU8911150.1 hypothetical protein [Aestuariicoccus sp. MJ-SS9]